MEIVQKRRNVWAVEVICCLKSVTPLDADGPDISSGNLFPLVPRGEKQGGHAA